MIERALRKQATPGRLKTTAALLRFCRENGHSPFWVQQLGECMAALEANDMPRVEELVGVLAQARMGSFPDWGPTHPDKAESEYLDTLWNALLGYWLEQMSVFRGQQA